MVNLDFYKGKTVLVTGHTGFKGTWLCKILINAGANVIGYAQWPKDNNALFYSSGIKEKMTSVIGDIRNYEKLFSIIDYYQPECIFHLAAQPIVKESYRNPRETFETNILGTVNVLEAARHCPSVKSVLNVTTDKVYLNKESFFGIKEDEKLCGFDPYSNSKSCSELVTYSYKNSLMKDVAISTARAGNVIGGGDVSEHRIIPDAVRAIIAGTPINVRNPKSIRPYQHVLEPLFVYLEIVEKQYNDKKFAGSYNVGPLSSDCITTAELISKFCSSYGEGLTWQHTEDVAGKTEKETGRLKLNISKLTKTFRWHPTWNIDETIARTASFTKVFIADKTKVPNAMDAEINDFIAEMSK